MFAAGDRVSSDGKAIALSFVMEPRQRALSPKQLTALRHDLPADQAARTVQKSCSTMTKAVKTVLKSVVPSRRCELTADELGRVGVESLEKHNCLLRCIRCKAVWSASVTADGTPHPFYWRCANRCNW
jgi:hypothetical protein